MSGTGSRCAACEGRLLHGRRESIRFASGFTLLELLVVLAIMLMMAAAFPLALDRALPGRRVTLATARLVAAIRDAQARSVAWGRPVGLPLTSLTRSFAASTHVAFTDYSGRSLSALTLYPDGSATGGRLRVADGSESNTLVVSAITGATQVVGH